MNNWFKRFFRKEEVEQQPSVPKAKTSEQSSIQKGDTEARVAYQYPQGNFRFPVIPDSAVENATRKPQPSSKRRQLEAERERRKREYELTYHSPEEEKQIKTRTKSQSQKSEEVPQKKFKRTEVPSPVHGYKRSRRYEGEQERKVSSSSSMELFDSLRDKLHTKEAQSNEATEQEITPREAGPELLFTKQVSETSAPLREEKNEPNDLTEVEQVNEQSIKLEQTENDLQQHQVLEEDVSHHEEEQQEQEPIQPIDESASDVPVHLSKEIELDIEHDEKSSERSEELELTKEEESHEVVLTEDESQHKEDKQEANEQPAPLKQTEAVEEKPQTAKRERTKKQQSSVVPFNVLMSKKDRQNWQSKENKPYTPEQKSQPEPQSGYSKPQLTLLDIPEQTFEHNDAWLEEQKQLLDLTLKNFNVNAKVVNVTCGPAVTRFEVQPEPGVKVSKITNLADDIKLNLAARDIRMEAPIPGKNAIGIEVPNQKSSPVYIREVLRSPAFMQSESPLTSVLGLDIAGEPMVTDIRKMPHGLIAGATGSGKSVCINSILLSILYKARPDEVKLLLIDPKMVELAPYNNIPHLVSPVITDVKAATGALKWAVDEMERRYKLFHHEGVRDINRYNQKVVDEQQKGEKMPYLVIIIDELADLMMMSPQDVEDAVCRIAQKARACGIHLLLATQRPSVDVITGLIKANIPTRVAFSVSSQVDSRTIIDTSGAEKLLGKGDMLFLGNGSAKSVRIQGTFVSDDEIDRVVTHVKKQMKPTYLFEQEELIKQTSDHDDEDELFGEACQFVVEQSGASASSLQRRFHIGYNRAARLVEMMEARGIVSEQKGSKPRDVLISRDQLEELQPGEKTIM